MSQQIDVITTATLRPTVYERTLLSFSPFLAQHDNWRLVLNVDPAGEGGTAADILALATRHFKHVVARVPQKPDFRLAWRWCVSQLEAELVFWLEDDWQLMQPVQLSEMLRIMRQYPSLATLRLPRWDATDTFRQWNKRALDGWNGDFFEIPTENIHNTGYSNNPSLTRREFLQPPLPHLKPDVDPEKQMSGFNGVCLRWLYNWRFGVFQRPWGPLVVRDIGENWRKKHKLGKGNKMEFSTWEKQDDI